MTWFNAWFRYSAVIALALLLLILPVSAVTQYNWTVGGDTIIVFNGTAGTTSWTPPAGVSTVNYLVIAGGGGGVGDISTGVGGGGGGGGGFLEGFNVPVSSLGSGALSVVVGAGGQAGKGRPATGQTRGGNSSLGSVISYGGGEGIGYVGGSPTTAIPNGSGGGAGGLQTITNPGTPGQGFAGVSVIGQDGGGGGGGAGEDGLAPTGSHNGGNGGRGNISLITKTPVYYAGGGGGSCADATGTTGGTGGLGGGGRGGNYPTNKAGVNGTANTGGGGGGGTNDFGGTGGSGIVIVSYKTPVTEIPFTLANGCWTATYNGYNYVKFNTTGSTTYTIPPGANTIKYVIVAGGGSGGAADTLAGSPGGAGGIKNGTMTAVPGTVVTVSVGAGGQAVTASGSKKIGGYAGGNSVFDTITATGGGKGGAWDNATAAPGNGGSGGGGVYTQAAGTGTAGQGQDGGTASSAATNYGTGGGGGNSTAGGAGSGTAAGNGGLGALFYIPNANIPLYIGGGGGGSIYADATGIRAGATLGYGSWGGGDGGANGLRRATNGTPETGGGGGGCGGISGTSVSGSGGSGVIYLSYLSVAPIPQYTSNVTGGPVRLAVQFNDTSLINPTEWAWNFTYGMGTANSSTMQNPNYTYLNPGTYTIWQWVRNSTGYNTSTTTITVTNPASVPTASFTTNKTLTYLPAGAFQFTDTSTPNVYAWQWNYTTSTNTTPYTFATSQNPVHSFTTPGIYYVTVKATNYLGSGTSAATPLIVNGFDAPRAGYTISPTTGTPGALILFNDTSTVPSVAGLVYNWSFGTGSVELNPYSDFQGSVGHVYNYGGVYNINLTVSNYNGTSFNFTNAGVTISTEQRMTNWYSPHQVRFRVLDGNDNPIKAAYINATAYESSLPGGFAGAQQVLIEMYGINSISASQMVSSAVQMQGYTGDDGSTSFTMHGNLKYLVYVTDLSGNTYTKTFYPQMDQYLIRVTSSGYTTPQAETNILDTQGNATLTFSEPNTTWCTMGLDYKDITSRTTNIAFTAFLVNNQTVMNYTSMAVTGTEHILLNYTVPNVRGQQWRWYYNATVV